MADFVGIMAENGTKWRILSRYAAQNGIKWRIMTDYVAENGGFCRALQLALHVIRFER